VSPAQRDSGSPEGGLDRAAAILGAFDASHRELTLAALVTRCGLPRSTTTGRPTG
jgi:DNA-binding IclR family transcriptional regulator